MTKPKNPLVYKVPPFVIEKRVKEYIWGANISSTYDVLAELNRQISILLDNAIRRCKQNMRSTMLPKDF